MHDLATRTVNRTQDYCHEDLIKQSSYRYAKHSLTFYPKQTWTRHWNSHTLVIFHQPNTLILMTRLHSRTIAGCLCTFFLSSLVFQPVSQLDNSRPLLYLSASGILHANNRKNEGSKLGSPHSFDLNSPKTSQSSFFAPLDRILERETAEGHVSQSVRSVSRNLNCF